MDLFVLNAKQKRMRYCLGEILYKLTVLVKLDANFQKSDGYHETKRECLQRPGEHARPRER